MPSSCFVPNCKSGYVSTKKRNKLEGKTNPSIFKAPSDAKTFDLWVKNVPRKHRPFGPNDGICEYHFTEDCIDRYIRSPLSEADRERCMRVRRGLKKGSVPSIFPNYTPPTEDDLRRKIPDGRLKKVEFSVSNVAETSVNDGSIAESSLCDSNVAELSVNVENITDPLPKNHCASKPIHANDIIEQSSREVSISDSSHQGTEITKPQVDNKFESINKNIELTSRDDHVPTPSLIDTIELSSSESLLSNDSISEPSTPENNVNKSPIRISKNCQSVKVPNTSSTSWTVNDLCNYVSSLQSLKDDNFTCCRVQSAAILQQWHPTSYYCIKMIIIEENLRPQIFVENERVYCEELLTLNRISSETKLQSLITLVKKLKVLPKISDFHLESFYNKIVQHN